MRRRKTITKVLPSLAQKKSKPKLIKHSAIKPKVKPKSKPKPKPKQVVVIEPEPEPKELSIEEHNKQINRLKAKREGYL